MYHWNRSSNSITQEHQGKLALILDAWTSSNGHAFLAIVARYVTKDFELGTMHSFMVLSMRLILSQRRY
jgi:hypothetical protein